MTITNAAQGIDQQTFSARVEAAAAYTAEFGAQADYDVEAGKAAVEAAKPGVDASALTEALTTLQTAQTAETDFLEAQVESEQFTDLVEELTGTELDDESEPQAIREAISGEFKDTADATGAYYEAATDVTDSSLLTDAGFAERSSSAQNQLIDDARADGEEAVANAEAEAQDGVLSALNSVQQSITRANNSNEAAVAAQSEFEGELARFTAVNSFAVDSEPTASDDPIQLGSTVTFTPEGGSEITLTLADDGTWSANDGADTSDLTGFDALVSDGNNLGSALVAVDRDETSLTEAVERAVERQEVGTGTDGEAAAGDYTVGTWNEDDGIVVSFNDSDNDSENVLQDILDARQTLSQFEEAVADFEFIRGIRDEVVSLNEDITDAEEAITDEEDGLGINLLEADDNFVVDEDDVYLFNEEDSAGVSLANFGDGSEDSIFFGEGFQLVQLDSDAAAEFTADTPDFSADVGSQSDLEIFWAEEGTALNLYVENKAFAGNSTSGDDFTQITLTGVSAEDVTFENGYLTAGEPA